MDEPSEDRKIVWGVMAQFWVDTSYNSKELDRFADRITETKYTLKELDRIVKVEVCGAFALFSLAVLLTWGLALPDWFYPEEAAHRKVGSWVARPRLLYWLNPFWIVGYFFSRGLVRSEWPKIRKRIAEKRSQGGALK